MKSFEILAPTGLKLLKTTPHKELHGKELVQAISLRVRLECSNEVLLQLHAGLQDMLFWRPPELDAQQPVEGVPPVKPVLRCSIVEGPLKLKLDLTGYTVVIDHGLGPDAGSDLELYECKLGKFAVDGKEGGTSSIEWSIGSDKQITPEMVGALCALEGGSITLMQRAPEVKADPIDGSVGHPGLAAQRKAEEAGQKRIDGNPEDEDADGEGGEPDATQTFVAQHDQAPKRTARGGVRRGQGAH